MLSRLVNGGKYPVVHERWKIGVASKKVCTDCNRKKLKKRGITIAKSLVLVGSSIKFPTEVTPILVKAGENSLDRFHYLAQLPAAFSFQSHYVICPCNYHAVSLKVKRHSSRSLHFLTFPMLKNE